MSDKATLNKTVAHLHVKIFTVVTGSLAALYATEALWLSRGHEPFVFCAANNMVDFLGLKGWYAFITYATCIMAMIDGAMRGFRHSIRWLVAVVILCAIPAWFAQGFSYGRTCNSVDGTRLHPSLAALPR